MYSAEARARRRCHALCADGAPCGQYAVWGDPPQRCAAQGGRPVRGSYEPCSCPAYTWPHRPGGGLCCWPEEPERISTRPAGRHALSWRRRPRSLDEVRFYSQRVRRRQGKVALNDADSTRAHTAVLADSAEGDGSPVGHIGHLKTRATPEPIAVPPVPPVPSPAPPPHAAAAAEDPLVVAARAYGVQRTQLRRELATVLQQLEDLRRQPARYATPPQPTRQPHWSTKTL